MKSLVLVGGGGHCKSVLEAAESAGYSILGVLDMPDEVGKEILSTKVIGTDDDIPAYIDKAEFVITVGFIKNPAIRIRLYNKIKEAGGKLATVVASTAYVSKYAEIGEGTRKSIIAAKDIKKGELLTEENLTVKRPGTGISPMFWEKVIGTKAVKDFAEDESITM